MCRFRATHCLSDVQKILTSQGANENLQKICAIQPSNLTGGSCPITDVNEFESTVDLSKLLVACETVDAVKDCCSQVCQSAVSEAARRIALSDSSLSSPTGILNSPQHSTTIDDCKRVVYRWLASRLDPDGAKQVLRRISNCNVNKAVDSSTSEELGISNFGDGYMGGSLQYCEPVYSNIHKTFQEPYLNVSSNIALGSQVNYFPQGHAISCYPSFPENVAGNIFRCPAI